MKNIRHLHNPSVAKTFTFLISDLGIAAITLGTVLGIYALDTVTPLGEPVWLLYLIPLGLAYWSPRYYAIPAVCAAVSLFLAAGLFLSPEGISLSHASALRLSFFLFFVSIAIVLWALRRHQIQRERL